MAAGVLAGAGSAAVGALLAYAGTSASFVLLGLVTLGAAVWLTADFLRRDARRVSPTTQAVLFGLRGAAWLLLLAILARPVWDWVSVDWHKPLLVVLLDESESMGIADPPAPATGPSRAQSANAAIGRAQAAIARLAELYEIRLESVGVGHGPGSAWRINPRASVTALASALRDATAMRSAHGRPPAAVLLISDGAENVEGAGAVRQAAADLAAREIPLLAAGVGPSPETTAQVELERLVVPPRLGVRDRLRVAVSARVQGCAGTVLPVEMLWSNERVAGQSVPIHHDVQHLGAEFDLVPPAPGLHRLTARVTLPASLGGTAFQAAAVVEVRDEGVRVLCISGAPHVESAFVTRALKNEPDIQLTARFVLGEDRQMTESPEKPADVWAEFDVVVLGRVPSVVSDQNLAELARAVTERGVGLLLVGGRRFFNEDDHGHAELADVCPVKLVHDEFGLAGPLQFLPTDAGLRHPILQGAALADRAESLATQPDQPGSAGVPPAEWLGLPPLGGAARLGQPKPAAEVLASDASGRALLVAQDVGRGRCVAAAWESTWPWAIASDQGAAMHRRVWRQLINWLANRRPRAWILTDETSYPLQALTSGRRRIQIRAGVSGLTGAGANTGGTDARLTLLSGQERRALRMERRGDEWRAELPGAVAGREFPAAGEYELEFSAVVDQTRPGERPRVEARTRFSVMESQLERVPPTANLTLLQAAAEQTKAQGGGYVGIEALSDLLGKLAQTDRREQVRRRLRYGVAEANPGLLLAGLVTLLSLEWAIRKRLGLA